MWDYDSLIGKAEVYFGRAAGHPNMDDDEFALWMLLGLEFLLRAPLAKIHPSLLAAPEGDSILHANGIPTSKEPRSIPTKTVLTRLKQTASAFSLDRENDASFLVSMRNAELHTGDAALANVPTPKWLPRLIRVVDVLCSTLGLDPADLITTDVEAHARALVDQEDAQTKYAVDKRISDARSLFATLTAEDVQKRKPGLGTHDSWAPWEPVDCPGCETTIGLSVVHTRSGAEQIDGDEVRTENIWVAVRLSCPVCLLRLDSTAEIAAAGLQQQYLRVVTESLEDRYTYADGYVDDDYGND